MAYKNIKPISTGVSPERVQEYKEKCQSPKPLLLNKIAWISILVSALIIFIIYCI